MMRCRFLLAALLAIVPVPASAQAAAARAPAAAASEDARLARLFAEDSRREDQLNPLAAIYRGRPADAAVFAQLFTDALDRHRLAYVRTSLRALERIDRRRLSPERQISFDVMLLAKRQQAAWLEPDMRMLTAERPLNHFGGLHVEFPTLIARGGALAYADEADYRAALALDIAEFGFLSNPNVE